MSAGVQRIVAAAVVIAAAWFGYQWLFPSDEAMIRALLDRIAESVSGAEGDSNITRMARAAGLRSELDPQITVDAGPPFSKLTGRDAVIGTAARFNTTARDVTISFSDVAIDVAPDRASARATLTAEARFRAAEGGRGLEARELLVTFRRPEGEWVVSDVTLIQTLQPLAPK